MYIYINIHVYYPPNIVTLLKNISHGSNIFLVISSNTCMAWKIRLGAQSSPTALWSLSCCLFVCGMLAGGSMKFWTDLDAPLKIVMQLVVAGAKQVEIFTVYIYIYTSTECIYAYIYIHTYIYIYIFSCSLPETLKLPSYHHSLHVLVNMHLMLSQPVSATGGSICSLVSWWSSSPLAPRVETTEKDPEVVPGSGGSDPSGRSLLYGSMKKTRGCFRK